MATLADNISKLEAVMATFLATSVSNTNTTKTDMTKTTTQTVTQIHVVTNFTNINNAKAPQFLPPFTPTATRHVIATINPPTMLDSLPNKIVSPSFHNANGNPEHGFRCLEICYHGHQWHPPKFVFLQTEPEPPWEPGDPRYKTMSLEDKAHFQAWGIDTWIRVKDQVF